MKTTDTRLQDRAAQFDECVSELSEQVQQEIAELVKWVSDHVLLQGGGIMSAKEFLFQVLRFESTHNSQPKG